MQPRSASAPTPTTSGAEPSSAALRAWRSRLADRLVVVRDLPWRRTRDPWEILVAEVMLQQTQVSRVIPAYGRFLSRFPHARACAEAPQSEVVLAWEGLGYHRRAVALHGAATGICSRFGGEIPSDFQSLVSLPGVGSYTARAIQAFAFELDVAIVDTNVARVISRAVVGSPLKAPATQRVADALVPTGRGWAHNQAMLDFGALRCSAKPTCSGCPLRRSCRWARSSWAGPDPAAATAGTSRRQAPFRGSDREARGRVLAAARQGPVSEATLNTLNAELHGERVTRACEGLIADGLVARRKGFLILR